jgi:hypothetical protein
MRLDDWINGTAVGPSATATPATSATVHAPTAGSVATVATVAVARAENRKSTGSLNSVQGQAAVALLSRAGARILPHHLRTIAVRQLSDTLELRQALRLLGYGAYAVAHLDSDHQDPSLDNKEQRELWTLYDHADEVIRSF